LDFNTLCALLRFFPDAAEIDDLARFFFGFDLTG
jgi:hypothetical protein